MTIFRKLLMKFLASQGDLVYSEFGDFIVQTTKEISEDRKLAQPVKTLMVAWLVSYPWAYFEELFIKSNSWNKHLLLIFENAQTINGDECALITQAFFLWHLEHLVKNRDDYKKVLIKNLEQYINRTLTKGSLLADKFKRFREKFQSLPPQEWYLEYIKEILTAIYTDQDKISYAINTLEFDSKLLLALNIYSAQMIKQAIRIDKKTLLF